MAIQQVVPVYINLLGDGSATVFTFSLSQMYQNGLGGGQPIGVTGVVPSSITVPNPPVPVTSATIDSFGNITITLTSALGSGVTQQFEIDLTFNSGLAVSDSTITASSVAVMPATTAVSLTTTGTGPTAVAQVSMAGQNSAAVTITSVGTGGQFIIEGSVDGTTWFQIDAYNEATESWVTGTITAAGSWWMEPLGAMQYVRIHCTVAPSAGAITGTLLASSQAMGTFEFQAANGVVAPNNIVIVGGSDGTNVRTLTTDASGHLQNASVPTTLAANAFTPKYINSTASSVIKNSAGNLYGVQAISLNVTTTATGQLFIQFYNTNTTAGLTTASWLFSLPIPAPSSASTSAALSISPGSMALANFSNGIVVVVNTTSTSNTAASGTGIIAVFFID